MSTTSKRKEHERADAPPGFKIIRLPALSVKLGNLGRSKIYEMVATGDLPAPIAITGDGGRAVGWIEAEIDAVIAARIAQRDAERAAGVSRQPVWLREDAAKAKAKPARPTKRKAPAAKRQGRKATSPAQRRKRRS